MITLLKFKWCFEGNEKCLFKLIYIEALLIICHWTTFNKTHWNFYAESVFTFSNKSFVSFIKITQSSGVAPGPTITPQPKTK